jgi:6-pyruvoyl-tetrahydropterin synthase
MMNKDNYLTIDGKKFNGDEMPLPSYIYPSKDILKRAERTIDGTMTVDVKNVKVKLEVVFDILGDKHLNDVTDLLLQDGLREIPVEFLSESAGAQSIIAYLDDLSYTPYVVGGSMMWQNVKLTFVEI